MQRCSMQAQNIRFELARDADAPAIAVLLRAAELPEPDFAPHVHFLVARDQGNAVVGAIGTEVYAPDGLLRSLVVAPALRRGGLGSELLHRLEAMAGTWQINCWWLLTTTAENFFAAHGFLVSPRQNAPIAIQRTAQFTGGCCNSAICMTRRRRTNP